MAILVLKMMILMKNKKNLVVRRNYKGQKGND